MKSFVGYIVQEKRLEEFKDKDILSILGNDLLEDFLFMEENLMDN